jgi:hypothetical protein
VQEEEGSSGGVKKTTDGTFVNELFCLRRYNNRPKQKGEPTAELAGRQSPVLVLF